jgi:hypothetical protein
VAKPSFDGHAGSLARLQRLNYFRKPFKIVERIPVSAGGEVGAYIATTYVDVNCLTRHGHGHGHGHVILVGVVADVVSRSRFAVDPATAAKTGNVAAEAFLTPYHLHLHS